jgi:hypothetical protein
VKSIWICIITLQYTSALVNTTFLHDQTNLPLYWSHVDIQSHSVKFLDHVGRRVLRELILYCNVLFSRLVRIFLCLLLHSLCLHRKRNRTAGDFHINRTAGRGKKNRNSMSCISSTGLLHITQIVRIKTGLDAGRRKKQDFWFMSPDHM